MSNFDPLLRKNRKRKREPPQGQSCHYHTESCRRKIPAFYPFVCLHPPWQLPRQTISIIYNIAKITPELLAC